MDETQRPEEQGPLPRSREAVDWWLKKWGRQGVLDGQEPPTREDVERLIEANGGTAEDLDLSQRNMWQVRLGGSDLEWANLESAYLAEANLQDADMGGANLKGANLWGADLKGAILESANLQGANLLFSNLQGADLRETNFQGAQFRGANLKGALLWLADLQGASFVGANLQGVVLIEANLQGANLWRADLQGADLEATNLQGADLGWVKLQRADLARASISPGTNLEGVEWDPKYISVLERRGSYEAASAVYRRLKEWYRGAGMLTIAGEFHYREQEASHKAGWQRLVRQFKKELATAWRELKGREAPASPEE